MKAAWKETPKHLKLPSGLNILYVKGQTISEWIYEVIVSPKYEPKFVRISAL